MRICGLILIWLPFGIKAYYKLQYGFKAFLKCYGTDWIKLDYFNPLTWRKSLEKTHSNLQFMSLEQKSIF